VERALSMVDGVLLLIDAQEGPMPQTRFVTKKALALGLRPIVVVNKVDKPGANPDKVINAAFDLFDKLGATDDQLDFPVVYASGINGWSSLEEGEPGEQWGKDMSALFDTILEHVPQHREHAGEHVEQRGRSVGGRTEDRENAFFPGQSDVVQRRRWPRTIAARARVQAVEDDHVSTSGLSTRIASRRTRNIAKATTNESAMTARIARHRSTVPGASDVRSAVSADGIERTSAIDSGSDEPIRPMITSGIITTAIKNT
jgi:hypothetical protein